MKEGSPEATAFREYADANNGAELDATMAPSEAKKELMKQTLTQGDIDGAGQVTPAQ